jgi:hypothetical protein
MKRLIVLALIVMALVVVPAVQTLGYGITSSSSAEVNVVFYVPSWISVYVDSNNVLHVSTNASSYSVDYDSGTNTYTVTVD